MDTNNFKKNSAKVLSVMLLYFLVGFALSFWHVASTNSAGLNPNNILNILVEATFIVITSVPTVALLTFVGAAVVYGFILLNDLFEYAWGWSVLSKIADLIDEFKKTKKEFDDITSITEPQNTDEDVVGTES